MEEIFFKHIIPLLMVAVGAGSVWMFSPIPSRSKWHLTLLGVIVLALPYLAARGLGLGFLGRISG